jgi:hypothetical protein
MPLPSAGGWLALTRTALASSSLAASSPTTSAAGQAFDAHQALFEPALGVISAAVAAALTGGQWVLGAATPAPDSAPGTGVYVCPVAGPSAPVKAQAGGRAVALSSAAGLAGEAGSKLPLALWNALCDGYAQAVLNVTAAELVPAASAVYGLIPLPIAKSALVTGMMAAWASDPRLATPEPQLRTRVAGLLADVAIQSVGAVRVPLVHLGTSPVPTPPPPALAAAVTILV